LERAACGYEGRPLISGIDLSVSPRDRIALLGPNGAGKSTFMKLLAGESAPLSGKLVAAADLNIGYFAQQQLEHLRTDCDAFWHLRNLGGPEFDACDEQSVRDHLGRFGFSGERAFEPVGTFSGGEKARLTLALLVARRPNLLLLDEPTNHLDIDMRHALTIALQNFTGGLVVVSHDRHLINSVADTLLLVADGKLKPFDGDLEDYQKWLQSRGRTARESRAKGQGSATAGGAVVTATAKQRLRDPIAKLRRQLEQVEERLEQLAGERRWLDAQEAAGDASLARRRANLARDSALLEAQWIEIGTALEAAENS
jgi:ATP-binding cassette subfamily F protein 3